MASTSQYDLGNLMDKYITRDRLMKFAREGRAGYKAAKPFPHASIDGLFPEALIEAVNSEFTDNVRQEDGRPFCKEGWSCAGRDQFAGKAKGGEIPKGQLLELFKMGLTDEEKMGTATRLVFMVMRSPIFLEFMEALTGIKGLVPDPEYMGSGLHQTTSGGNLNVH